ncbi:MAG TPA: asparagine synthase-related protein [Pyrinomonadaceae bacterium]
MVILVNHYPATPESVSEDQPVITPTVVLAYEGRVDNREEIGYALGLPRLAQQPDGAVLTAAYDAWGEKLSAKVIGEYAYAAFDRRTQQLVAGQDSLGVRRLFYCTIGERVLLTSNLRLLFQQFPETRPPYDREVLREYFAGAMMPWSGRTIWRGVRELGRGSVLVQRGEKLEEKTAWQPKPVRRERFATPAEVDEVFRKLLFDAVRAALRSPGPVLCDLSGGYDSSTVCSVAALLTEAGESLGPVIGWSLVSRRSDEEAFQDSVRGQYRIESHTLDLESHLPFQTFTDTEIPTGGFVQLGSVERAVREFARARGIRSHLTGKGADALFNKGGDAPVYLAEWIRERRFTAWSRHFVAYLKGGSFNAWHLLRDCTVGSLDVHAAKFRESIPSWITPAFRKEISEANHEYLHTRARTFRSDARERMYRWTLCFVPSIGRALPDERVPLLYRPLVEFILGLDWNYIVHPSENRVLMRRSLRGILPEAVRTGGGQTAFSATFFDGLRAAWPRLSHVVTGERLAELGVVERKPFQANLEAMRAGYPGPNMQFSNTALYLETWLGLKALSTKPGPGLRDSVSPGVRYSSV